MKSCFHFTALALPCRLMRSTSRYRPRSNANTLYVHASVRNTSTFSPSLSRCHCLSLFCLHHGANPQEVGPCILHSGSSPKREPEAQLLFPTRSSLTSVSRVHQRVSGAFSVHGVSPGPSPSSREVISPACCHHLCRCTSRKRSS